jgi:hypothetical protein
MNRRRFFEIMGILAAIPILNKYLPALKNPGSNTWIWSGGTWEQIPIRNKLCGGLQIVDYDPTTHTATVDRPSPPDLEDGAIWTNTDASDTELFVDGVSGNSVNTWSEALALSQKMKL